jgi:hypothetical protein
MRDAIEQVREIIREATKRDLADKIASLKRQWQIEFPYLPAWTRRPSHRVPGEFLSSRHVRKRSQDRRASNRAAGICINAPAPGRRSRYGVTHGKPSKKNGKCSRCTAIAKLSR